MATTPSLSPRRERAAVALAAAIVPAGRRLPAGNARTVTRAAAIARDASDHGTALLGGLVDLFDHAALLRTGRRFHRLSPERQERLLVRWEDDPVLRWPLSILSGMIKLGHFDDPDIYRSLDCVYAKGGPPESVRWWSQVASGDDQDEDEEIEADVVVIGSGAGGAVVGKELAERGHAVVFLEEGHFYRRDAFNGSAVNAHQNFYRGKAGITTLGNNIVPVVMGRLVGGSTAINTGTCFRTPDRVLEDWCERIDSDELSPAAMAPYFDKVERELRVGPNKPEYIGPIGDIVARGCDALGWSHFPVRRNAPDCDGQGVCDWGCPTNARLSMDISYLPAALKRGAMLFTETRARRIRIENRRAVGVEAVSESGKRLRFRSRLVILAGGAIPTPLFLLDQGICNGSGQVGRNLSIHPGSSVSALFEQRVAGYNHIMQGYASEQFHRDGILLLGAQASIDIGALLFSFNGRRYTEVMERFDHVGSFGAMIEDTTQNGRVRAGPRGWPILTYNLQPADVDRLHQGLIHVMEIFQAAGADRFFPTMRRPAIVEGAAGLDAFRKLRPKPWDFVCTSFHPLGTCRMGPDPFTNVVGADHQTHELPGLFIVDGSTVPGPPAVNPQLTIMAMATRAADKIAPHLE